MSPAYLRGIETFQIRKHLQLQQPSPAYLRGIETSDVAEDLAQGFGLQPT